MKKILFLLLLTTLGHTEYIFHNNGGPAINTSITQLRDGYACAQVDVVNDILNDSSCVLSDNWRLRILYDSFGLPSLNYTTRFLRDQTNTASVGWDARNLIRSDTSLALDWENSQLLFNAGAVMDFSQFLFFDAAANTSIDWDARNLFNAAGVVTLDWQAQSLITQLGDLAVDWRARQLIAPGGAQPVLDWTAQSLTDLGSGAATVSWGPNTLLISNTDLVTSVDWTNRILVDQNNQTELVWQGNNGGANLGVNIRGTDTNTSAAAGFDGEYIVSSVVVGGAVALVTATPKTITSILLSPGDWDVSGVVCVKGAVTATTYDAGITTANNAFTGAVLGDSQVETPAFSTAASASCQTIPAVRQSLAANQTTYLVASMTFTIGAPTAFGRISARRVQ